MWSSYLGFKLKIPEKQQILIPYDVPYKPVTLLTILFPDKNMIAPLKDALNEFSFTKICDCIEFGNVPIFNPFIEYQFGTVFPSKLNPLIVLSTNSDCRLIIQLLLNTIIFIENAISIGMLFNDLADILNSLLTNIGDIIYKNYSLFGKKIIHNVGIFIKENIKSLIPRTKFKKITELLRDLILILSKYREKMDRYLCTGSNLHALTYYACYPAATTLQASESLYGFLYDALKQTCGESSAAELCHITPAQYRKMCQMIYDWVVSGFRRIRDAISILMDRLERILDYRESRLGDAKLMLSIIINILISVASFLKALFL